MWNCTDNQDVGLEAAIIERVRNSSLVKWFCADNVTGLKSITEATDFRVSFRDSGVVGEHSLGGEAGTRVSVDRREERMPV